MTLLLTSSTGLVLGSSTTQLNLLGRAVTNIPWKQVAVGGALAGAVSYLTGLGWSMGMGTGASIQSPNVQYENARAYKRGLTDQEITDMERKAKAQMDLDAQLEAERRQRYLDQQMYNKWVDYQTEVFQSTLDGTAFTPQREYRLVF
jgi:hypothetical protein